MIAIVRPPSLQRFIKQSIWLGRVRWISSTSCPADQQTQPIDRPVVRFAPSPTGQLHLGGLRTALFNHLFARSTGGRWILRIEDTDQKRVVPGAAEAMQDILKWSGLDYDEGPDKPGERGPYFQSQRQHLYKRYADQLLQAGQAYRDFRQQQATPSKDEQKDGQVMVQEQFIDAEYIPPTEEEAQRLIEQGKTFVIRLRRPSEGGHVVFDDVVYGTIRIPKEAIREDPILVKSDGWPTYHLANVVDDIEMGITHVLRGEEWIPSTPTHLALYAAFGRPPPKFVHLPLLTRSDGRKLSKREQDVQVASFRSQNYEPQAVLNFVALLGYNWHKKREKTKSIIDRKERKVAREVFTMEEMTEDFSLESISRSRAIAELLKLTYLNRQHIMRKSSTLSEDERQNALKYQFFEKIYAEAQDIVFKPHELLRVQLEQMVRTFLMRSHNVDQAYAEVIELFKDVDYDSPEAQEFYAKLSKETAPLAWKAAHDGIAETWQLYLSTPKYVRGSLKNYITRFQRLGRYPRKAVLSNSLNGAAFMKPLRFALTGKKEGPALDEIVVLLGRARCQERLRNAMQWHAPNSDGLSKD